MADRLSEHFALAEFACKCGRWPRCTRTRPLPALVAALETARARHYPTGLVIESGVRCAVHNATVGGAKRSRHVAGAAADLRVPRMRIREAIACGFVGIGVRRAGRQWIVSHVDIRSGPVVVWQYPSRAVVPESEWT